MKFNFQLIVKSRLAFALVLFLALSIKVVAQLNVGSLTPPNASAMLQVTSSNKGFLLPQVALVSTISPSPLTANVAGMLVYNTATSGSGSTAVTPGLYVNNGFQWNQISTQSGTSSATYTGGTLTCGGTQSGTYQAGTAMTGSNTQVATITIATGGSYSVTTSTVNGVSFSAAGTALSTGASNFTLTAAGTPLGAGTFAYPISFGGQNCSFNVTFSGNASSGGGAIISSTTCGSAVVTGTLTNGVAASGVTVSIPVNTTTAGNYVIATTTVNGIMWSGTGTLTAGAGNIVLTASGTPTITGSVSYLLNTTPGCSFSATNAVSPSSGGSAIVSAWNCTGTDAGTLQIGVAANGVTHAITATVTTVGTYSVTSTTNGITYTGSGTFAGTGSQVITLTASGTPTTSGSNSFTTSVIPACSFTLTVAPAATFACASATTVQSPTGILVNGTAYTGSYTIAYTAGNGTAYGTTNQTVNGLTLTRTAGTFASGGGNVVYNLTGTAGTASAATFTISECTVATFGCQNDISSGSGTIVQMMYDNTGSGTANYSWCARTVTGPDGLTWLDRNLGAQQVATSSTDAGSYGSMYQWGRQADGHQRTGSGRGVDVGISTTTATVATTNTPGNALFITTDGTDWRNDNNNNRWNSITGSGASLVQENNPCPSGYHVPTNAQQVTLASGWTNAVSAYNSTLKLPMTGYRLFSDGSLNQAGVGGSGRFWSSTPYNTDAYYLYFDDNSLSPSGALYRPLGYSVRCVKN